ncbi:MAG: hypothetical protein JXR39_07210 [Marinilabiliaceae bacterium]|nr:hypothetical protein [Marinilabiliaceae bacterium]
MNSKPLPITVNRQSATDIQPLLKRFNHSLFITPQWVESMAINGCSPIYLQFDMGPQVVGFIIGLEVPGGPLQGTQLYFYAGPAIDNNDLLMHEKALMALRAFARKQGYSKISIRPFDQQLSTPCNPKGYRRTNSAEYIYFFPNEDTPPKMSYGFKKNVKKGRKIGAALLASQHHRDLQALFRLIEQTKSKRVNKYGDDYNPLGLLNLGKESLSRLLDTELGLLYLVEVEQDRHCIQLCLEDEQRNYALLMGANEFAYENGLASFLDASVETLLREKKFKYLNLGSVPADNGGAGLIQYKEAMGCRRYDSYGYYTYFLTFPLLLLNPLYKAGHLLPDNGWVKNLKTAVSRVISRQ